MTVSAEWHDFATMIGGASGALTDQLASLLGLRPLAVEDTKQCTVTTPPDS